jgi:sodium/potassium-transporting ATPase subunit alpha
VICTDKTGTLTQNKMEVRETWTPAGPDGRPDGRTDSGTLMKAAILCNNAVYEGGRYRGDPTEAAILKAARKSCGDVPAIRLTEIPFDSERKMMTTVCEAGGKTSVFTKGALEAVMPRCSFILAGGEAGPLGSEAKKALEETYFRMTDDGLRVLAFACKEDVAGGPFETAEQAGAIESGLTFVGLMGLEDPLRPEVPEAVRKCVGAGIRVVMLTGDASRTALAVARRVGLAGEGASAVEGRELDAMSDSALRDVLLKEGVVFSRMTPLHKMRIVSVLKDEGERVAVTGDGVNDAPALRKADIGIAMGLSGTDVAREAADMVLLDDNFATIVSAVEEGRAIFQNIKKFITYIFAHLTPEAVPYIMYAIFNIPLPLTVMQILAIDLGTETIPALALGMEPPEASVMEPLPHKKRTLIDPPLLLRSYVFLGLLSAAAVMTVYFYVLESGGWRWGMALPDGSPLAHQASAAVFLGIVVMQVGNVFACRSYRESAFRPGFFANRLMLLGIVVEIALAAFIIYHPLGNRLFDTAPLGIGVWLILVPFSAVLLGADELRKRFAR